MSSQLLSSLRTKLNQISAAEPTASHHDEKENHVTEDLTGGATSILSQIHEQGDRPEDWLSYTDLVREKATFPSHADRDKALRTLYNKALKAIPNTMGKHNQAYAQLLVNNANIVSKQSPDDATSLFTRARYLATKFALVHVGAAQFEVKQGNESKAMKILEKAKELQAEPLEMVKKAFRNLVLGHAQLLSEDDIKTYHIQANTDANAEAGPSVIPSVVDTKSTTGTSSSASGDGLLLPRRSWIDGRSNSQPQSLTEEGMKTPMSVNCRRKPYMLQQQQQQQQQQQGSGGAHTDVVTNKPPKMYTDHIVSASSSSSRTKYSSMSDSGSEDSATQVLLKTLPPRIDRKVEKDDNTVSLGNLQSKQSEAAASMSEGDETVPCPTFDNQRGVYQRTALRSYNSTPDCKQGSMLSRSHIKPQSGRKGPRIIPTGRAMRVMRTSLPQLHEGDDNTDAPMDPTPLEPVPVEPEPLQATPTQKEDTSTMDLLRGRMEPMDMSGGEHNVQHAREADVRKMSTGSDSGILTQPLDSMDVATACSANSTLQNTATQQATLQPYQVNTTTTPSSSSQQQIPSRTTASMITSTTASSASSCFTAPPPPAAPVSQPLPPPAPAATPHGMMPQGMMPPASYPMTPQQQQQMMMMGMMAMPAMAPNVLTVNGKSYTIIRLLGKGGSCKVWECLTPDTQMSVAIKCVSFENVDSTTINSYKNEIRLLQRLQDSHRVIKLLDFEHNQCANMLYVVMEKGDTDLATFFRQRSRTGDMSPQLLSFYWSEMLKAVQVLHKEGIVHSDLKPANFLLVAGNLKLIDFGIANAIQPDMTSITLDQQVGTLNYMSPEAIRDMCDDASKTKPTIKIGVKSDVWSLGCILYNLVYGKTPFQHITNQIVKLKAIMDNNMAIKFPTIGNPDLLNTLQMCLIREPRERFSIEDLLSHPYCKK